MPNCNTCPKSTKPAHDAKVLTKKPTALGDASNKANSASSSNNCGKSSSDCSKDTAGKCANSTAEKVTAPLITATPQPALTRPPELSRFELQMLLTHNAYREHHNTPALVPCPILAKRAQCWAETLAKRNCMFHEKQGFDGENLAMMYGAPGVHRPGNVYVNMWYYEGLYYRFAGTQLGAQNVKGRNYVTGHFSQLVWKNSRQVGFGRAVSRTGRVYVVARYRPRGNWLGWYSANVLPPKDGKLRCQFCP